MEAIAMKRKILILGGSYMNLQMKTNPRTKENNITLGGEEGGGTDV